jgi:predicted lactoylglutathione lyase
MIGYTTLGTNDFDRACGFYDALFGSIGESRIMDIDNFVVWGTSMEQPGFSITRPFDGNAATVGNGVMIAILMPSKEAVDAFYARAMALGASDEGAPGDRGDGFYAGYFRDLDGNKLNAFFMG